MSILEDQTYIVTGLGSLDREQFALYAVWKYNFMIAKFVSNVIINVYCLLNLTSKNILKFRELDKRECATNFKSTTCLDIHAPHQ